MLIAFLFIYFEHLLVVNLTKAENPEKCNLVQYNMHIYVKNEFLGAMSKRLQVRSPELLMNNCWCIKMSWKKKLSENRFLKKGGKKTSSERLFQSLNDFLFGWSLDDDIILFLFKTVVGGKTLHIFLETTSQSGWNHNFCCCVHWVAVIISFDWKGTEITFWTHCCTIRRAQFGFKNDTFTAFLLCKLKQVELGWQRAGDSRPFVCRD